MLTLFRFLFVCGVLLAIVGCGVVGVTIWHFDRDLPDYQKLAHYQPAIMTRVHAGDGRLLAEYATERRVFVPIDPKGDWAARLAKVPVPAVASDVGWRLTVVIRSDADGASIGFKGGATGHIPFFEM